MEYFTRLIGRAVDFLILGYPVRSAVGVLLGAFLNVLIAVLGPVIESNFPINVSEVKAWHSIVIGLTLAYLPIIPQLLYKRPKFDEATERALQLIKLAEAQGVPRWHIGRLYIELCEAALRNLQHYQPLSATSEQENEQEKKE